MILDDFVSTFLQFFPHCFYFFSLFANRFADRINCFQDYPFGKIITYQLIIKC